MVLKLKLSLDRVQFSSLANADLGNVKGPLDMIYIKWSILFFLFSSSSPAGPQRQTQTLRKCSARRYLHCEKLSYKAQCLSGGKKQTLSHSSSPRLIVLHKSLYFVGETALLIKRHCTLHTCHCRHVKAVAVEQDTVWISSIRTMMLWDFSYAQVSKKVKQCSVFPLTGRLEQNPNELGWLAELNY